MYRACIVVADASRARLFQFERSQEAEGLRETLVETRDLVDPARRLRPSTLFSDSRPGTNRTGNLQYALDDHRDASIDRLDATFAREIVDAVAEMVRAHPVQRIVVCASPNMLGTLRRAGEDVLPSTVTVDQLSRDLVKLTPTELRDQLASYGFLPAVPTRA